MIGDIGSVLETFTLLRPWWLLAVPVILLIGMLARRGGDLGDWRRAIDPHLLKALDKRGAVLPPEATTRRISPWLAAALLAAVALAGPAIERDDAAGFRNLDGLVIAVDSSRSMAQSGGLADGGIGALQIVSAAARQTALVLYAGDAYLATPFTADPAVLTPMLAGAPADLVPEAGSVPARAIATGRLAFEASRMIGGDLVLVTDGDGLDEAAFAEAELLRGAGKRLHVLFAPGRDIPDRPEPDRDGAQRLAAVGGGLFTSVAEPAPILAALAGTAADRMGASGYGALFLRDYGRWLLLLGAVPLLITFRRTR